MSSNLAAWQAWVENELAKFRSVPQVAADWGVTSSPNAGWVHVTFNRIFAGVPGVMAVQGARGANPKAQFLKPPVIPRRTVPPLSLPNVSLSALKLSVPPKPKTWGDQVKQVVTQVCGSTIGTIPVVGGYLCSGIESTFGAMLAAVADAVQGLYYTFDAPALLQAIAQSAENKAATDFNNALNAIEAAINSQVVGEINSSLAKVAGDVNGALSTLEVDAQDAINSVYHWLNEAIGLFDGLAIPVVQVRNIATNGFEVYSAGGVPIYWLSLYASG